MQALRFAAATLLLGLASCTGMGQQIPEDQLVQYQPVRPPFPYNSPICP